MLTSLEMVMALTAGLNLAAIAGLWRWPVVALCGGLLASWWIPWRYSSTPAQQRIMLALLGLPFVAVTAVLLVGSQSAVATSQGIAVLGSVYLLSTALLEVFRKTVQARPAIFHQAVGMVMLVGGLSRQNPYYPQGLAMFCGAGALLLRRPYPGLGPGKKAPSLHWPGLGVALAFAVALGLAHWLFWEGMPGLGRAFFLNTQFNVTAALQPDAPLFGSSSDLSTVRRASRSRALSARVVAPGGRLRGQVLTTYENGHWSAPLTIEQIKEFKLRDGVAEIRPGQGPTWTIYPVKPVSGQMPGPPGAFRVRGTFESLEIDPFGGLRADTLDPYEVSCDGLLGGDPQGCDQLPPELAAQLAPIGERLLGASRGQPLEEARRLESYLADHGTYDLQAKRQPGRDPVIDFLDGNLTGYCEYFATSMALLLRQRGVACRYVVGFLLRERNALGGYWMVRDCDAHAWVEAYDPHQGWVAFDPTPAAHLEERTPDSGDSLWDGAKMALIRSWQWVLEQNWVALGALAGLLALTGGAIWLKPWRSWRGRGPLDPLERLRRQALGRWARLGLHRGAAETWWEFAGRAQDLAPVETARRLSSWVELYCAVRYRPRGVQGGLEELEELTKRL